MDPGERCDCVGGARPCAHCGLMVKAGSRCACRESHMVLVTSPDYSRKTTRALGDPDAITRHYREETDALSIYFIDTGEIATFDRAG